MRRKPHKIRVGVDLMGAELAPQKIVQCLQKQTLGLELVFAADRGSRLTGVLVASDRLESDVSSLALRKLENSLALLLRKLKEGELDVVISANRTAAVVTQSRLILKTGPSKTCALMTHLPACGGKKMAIVDVGANVDATPQHLLRFAELGADQIHKKGLKIGLLNIGAERSKGPEHWKRAYVLLERFAEKKGYEFRGNVEPSTLFCDPVDLVVTEAVAGNIFLKTVEGTARMLLSELKVTHPPQHLDWASYPGALLVGVTKPVIKVHGYATEKGFLAALAWAKELVL